MTVTGVQVAEQPLGQPPPDPAEAEATEVSLLTWETVKTLVAVLVCLMVVVTPVSPDPGAVEVVDSVAVPQVSQAPDIVDVAVSVAPLSLAVSVAPPSLAVAVALTTAVAVLVIFTVAVLVVRMVVVTTDLEVPVPRV